MKQNTIKNSRLMDLTEWADIVSFRKQKDEIINILSGFILGCVITTIIFVGSALIYLV